MLCAIGLAKELLGANIERAPEGANAPLPVWLIENVLRQWENPNAADQPPMSHPVPLSRSFASSFRTFARLEATLAQSYSGDHQRQRPLQRVSPAALSDGKLYFPLGPPVVKPARAVAGTLSLSDDPLILSLETATLGGSVWLGRGPLELAAAVGDPAVSQSNSLLSDINRCLSDAGVSLDQVDLFACASGPGSFTGIRIGIATLKGLAATLNRPCLGIPTLEAVAHAAGESSAIVAVLPAGRGEVFAQMFSASNVSNQIVVSSSDQAAHLSPQKLIEKYGFTKGADLGRPGRTPATRNN